MNKSNTSRTCWCKKRSFQTNEIFSQLIRGTFRIVQDLMRTCVRALVFEYWFLNESPGNIMSGEYEEVTRMGVILD